MFDTLLQMSRAVSSDFKPKLKKDALFPFQVAGVEYLCKCGKFGLLADEMGLGKSVQAIVTMNTLGIDKYVVVCPASLQENWRREIIKWSTAKQAPRLHRPKRCANIVIISYGALKGSTEFDALLRETGAGGLILDEAQYIKNPKARRSKAILQSQISKKLQKVIALSGTPIENHPIEAYPLLSTFCPEAIGNMTRNEFGNEYSNAKYNPWSKSYEFVGSKNEENLGLALRSHCMVRRLKKDVLHDLPEKTRQIVYLRHPKEVGPLIQREIQFQELKQERALKFDEQDEFMRVRLQLGLTKVPDAAEYIETLLENTGKLVVFAHHREVIAALLVKLARHLPTVLTGGTSNGVRQERVDRFQNDPKCRVFLGSLGASGVGHTLHAADTAVMVEASWVPGVNLQCEDRIHRIGQHEACFMHYLTYSGSVDCRVLEANRSKSDGINKIMD
jgi:SWI/SNF-related matrix-associated actin-dependent regulator of chromatin subfamily A-like protein 1